MNFTEHANLTNRTCDYKLSYQNVSDIDFVTFVNVCADCIPNEDKQYRTALGIWALINAIIGILGNMLTLLAIPYAARKKR